MPKDTDDSLMSELGNWNTAADYARFKIMKPLYLADEYEMIATFGSIDLEDIYMDSNDLELTSRNIQSLFTQPFIIKTVE